MTSEEQEMYFEFVKLYVLDEQEEQISQLTTNMTDMFEPSYIEIWSWGVYDT